MSDTCTAHAEQLPTTHLRQVLCRCGTARDQLALIPLLADLSSAVTDVASFPFARRFRSAISGAHTGCDSRSWSDGSSL
eukprot:1612332-Rhodomonas_salina.4